MRNLVFKTKAENKKKILSLDLPHPCGHTHTHLRNSVLGYDVNFNYQFDTI